MKHPLLKVLLLILISSFCFSQTEKKNVIFIMVDDLKPAIKSFGDMSAVTPNIDKLSKKISYFH